jgi:MtrB/PioB family decaheme-associated outer membrane protein
VKARQLCAARGYLLGALCVYASTAMGQDPFEPLKAETRPLATRWQTDYSGVLQLGLGYIGDDNFMFGQYNGLHEKGPTVIGNLQWNDFRSGDNYWQVSLSDLGLDTREGELVWGIAERLKLKLGFDSQIQVRNDTGRTPFRGSDQLTLPENWVSASYTGDFTGLDSALQTFDRQLDRKRYSFGLEANLAEHWQLSSNLSYEDKEGRADVGGAIYIDAASGDAALLPAPVDYSTTEFDLGLSFEGKSLYLHGKVAYSDFDNQQSLLSWQNPYSSFGPSVAYPAGTGGLGLAPDNTLLSGRLSGHWILNTVTRLQFDGSYSVAGQDQRFADYSVNPLLGVTEPLPRSNLNGEVATSTFIAKLLMRPAPKFNLNAKVEIRDKDYDSPRDGYQYILGDGGDQAPAALTVYNTAHDYLSQTLGFEAGYRLPKHSKISLDYEFEEVERTNAAVEETRESRLTVGYQQRELSSEVG